MAQTHSSLISWVADVLLYLTSSDNEDDSEEAPPISSPGTATSTTLAHVCDLKSSCMGLSEQLNRFTKEIITLVVWQCVRGEEVFDCRGAINTGSG